MKINSSIINLIFRLFICLVMAQIFLFCHTGSSFNKGLEKLPVINQRMDTSYQSWMDSLESVYGKSSQDGFGSAVLYGVIESNSSIDSLALTHYKYFLGKKWNPEREKSWMSSWKKVYERREGNKNNILAELSSISDRQAKRTVPLLTELLQEPERAKKALQTAFDNDEVKYLEVYNIGDGEAMSGIILFVMYKRNYFCSVIALMD